MKKLFALLTALCLLLSAVPAVFADAWIPVEDEINQALCDLPEKEGDCAVLNAFLTRYAETGITELSSYFSTEEDYFKSLLKHFELNPTLYPDSIRSFTDAGGIVYMEIDAECFEAAMVELYCNKFPAENCPGYSDGKIRVSAENFGAEKRVFASAVSCSIMGPNLYHVYFETYMTISDPEDLLAIPNSRLDKDSLTLLAEGSCMFHFNGDIEQSSFTMEDFSFYDFSVYELYANIPNSGGNSPAAPDVVPDDDAYVEVSTDAESPSEEDLPATDGLDGLTGIDETEAEPTTEEKEKEDDTSSFPIPSTVWIAIGVVALAAVSTLIILLVFKKKK